MPTTNGNDNSPRRSTLYILPNPSRNTCRGTMQQKVPRCVWTGQETPVSTSRGKPSGDFLKSEMGTAAPTSDVANQRISVEINTRSPVQEPSKSAAATPKEVPSRRAMSVDGDSIKQFQTAHILRSHYMDVHQLYDFQEELGRGACGVVKRCTDKLTGQTHACKTILKSGMRCQLDVEDLKAEVTTLQAMQCHPSVVRLRGVFEDSRCAHLVMEFCEGGDLFSRIKQKTYYSEAEAARVCMNLASVLASAHKQGIMHRDLKPENILMASRASDTDIQLADFGSAAVFRPGQKLNQLIGSPLYIAPSVLQHRYGPEADLWSLGVVLYILLCGVPPFWGRSNAEIFRSIQHAPLNLEKGRMGSVSREAKHLLSLLLNRNTEEAISASDVLDHPWILKHCSSVCSRVNPSLTRRSSVAFADQVKSAMAVSESSARYSLNVARPSRSFRRHSLGVFRKEEVSLAPVEESASGSDEDEAPRRKNVLYRMPTPFRPSSSGTEADEEDEDSYSDESDVFDEEDADVARPQIVQLARKPSASTLRLKTGNHGDLIRRTDTSSSDDSQIPVAEPIEVREGGAVLSSSSSWLEKATFIPVVRGGVRVSSRAQKGAEASFRVGC